jgi:hypothetical protein
MPKESANTSLNQVSSGLKILKKITNAETGHVNIDIGGGKYNRGTEYLRQQGIENLVYDPFNRTSAHNEAVRLYADMNRANSITILNVLNTIPDKSERMAIIDQALTWVDFGGIILISIYEKNKDGILDRTSKGFQNNQPTQFYADEISAEFGDFARMEVKGNYIVIQEVY